MGLAASVLFVERNEIAFVRIKKMYQKTYMRSITSWRGGGGGGEFFLSVSPGIGNRPPRKKKIANPRGVCPGGMVTSKIEPCIDH